MFFDHEVVVDNLELNSLSSELSEESESEVADIPQIHSSLQSELRDAFTSSQYFKIIIQNTPNLDAPWPPTSNEIHLDSARKLIPLELFNFMAWLTGTSCDPTFENRVQIGSDTERKLLSICQDIIHLACRGRKQIPKHLALAMTVRHLTGSSILLQLLNKLGHSASHSTILEHDAALASLQIQNNDSVPQGFTKNTFTTLVWDNNDFGEETLTGKGTTHNTNGIIIQSPRNDLQETANGSRSSIRRTFRRTVDPPTLDVTEYVGIKKQGPTLSVEHHSIVFYKC